MNNPASDNPPVSVAERARQIAADRDRGASEILARLLPLLQKAVASGREATAEIVTAICRAQPGMASLWNACATAAAGVSEPERFQRAHADFLRAPAALRAVAVRALSERCAGAHSARFVTVSYSGSVLAALTELAASISIEVTCAESRPRLEGRRMATDLAEAGARVTVVTDAAVSSALDGATAVIAGADAVTRFHWINKIGTRSLTAVAAALGTEVLVLASRDKFIPAALESHLRLLPGPPDDVWETPHPRVVVANPIFEHVSLVAATLLITDRGVVAPSDAGQLASAFQRDATVLLGMLRARTEE